VKHAYSGGLSVTSGTYRVLPRLPRKPPPTVALPPSHHMPEDDVVCVLQVRCFWPVCLPVGACEHAQMWKGQPHVSQLLLPFGCTGCGCGDTLGHRLSVRRRPCHDWAGFPGDWMAPDGRACCKSLGLLGPFRLWALGFGLARHSGWACPLRPLGPCMVTTLASTWWSDSCRCSCQA
jgi:hypothetical protein